MRKILISLLALSLAGPLSAQTVDVDQPSDTVCMAIFSQGDLAQSFKPTVSSCSGASLFMRVGIGSSETVFISLYDNLPTLGGIVLASGSVVGNPGTWADVFWPSVPVTAGTTYFLVFSSSAGTMCVAGDTANPYPDGQVYANPGFGSFPTFDYTFRTWVDGGLTLSVSGVCPGPVQISLSGATPNGSVAFAYGLSGSFVLPPGSCMGTVLDISSPTLAAIIGADGGGSIALAPALPAGLCGLTLQAVDLTSCSVSNTVVL